MAHWRYTINIKPLLNRENEEWESARDDLVVLLMDSPEYGDDFELQNIVEEMSDTSNLEWFNATLSSLYDWADNNLVWMGLY